MLGMFELSIECQRRVADRKSVDDTIGIRKGGALRLKRPSGFLAAESQIWQLELSLPPQRYPCLRGGTWPPRDSAQARHVIAEDATKLTSSVVREQSGGLFC